jgi:hypothetical protein
MQAEIVRMMIHDAIPTGDAVNLATMIIEYERTLVHERQSFAEWGHFDGEDVLKDITGASRIRDRLIMWKDRVRLQQDRSAMRYRKRASSQLIKTLKWLI